METTKLVAIVGLLIALSVASERMVEIVKGLFKSLDAKKDDEKHERWRKAALQGLSVGFSALTTWLVYPAVPADLLPASSGPWPVLALGFLASGGSGLWNSVLTYVLKVKDIKDELASLAATKAKLAAEIARGNEPLPKEKAGLIAQLDSSS